MGAAGSTGYTPLHYAARAGHTKAVQLLLRHGERSSNKSPHTPHGLFGCAAAGLHFFGFQPQQFQTPMHQHALGSNPARMLVAAAQCSTQARP